MPLSDHQHNPNGASSAESGLFGLPHRMDSAAVVLLPVPWDLTTSYGRGASQGPAAILQASAQLDLYYPLLPDLWRYAPFMLPINHYWLKKNQQLNAQAQQVIAYQERNDSTDMDAALQQNLRMLNQVHQHLTQWVQQQTDRLLRQQKIVGLIGGEHSVSLGLLQSLSRCYQQFGILHIDAHLDMRAAYMGFTQSHASVMYHALELPQLTRLVSVAVRDFCADEMSLVQSMPERIRLFSDRDIHQRLYQGACWDQICTDILHALPEYVYISFDIDGLSPEYCPHTGTPVPGGISYHQAVYLIQKLAVSGKQVIGFDLVEVAPGNPQNREHHHGHHDYDANVGARILWELTGCAYLSRNNMQKQNNT